MTTSSSFSLPITERKGILTVHRSGLDFYSSNNNSNDISTIAQPPVIIFLSGFPDTAATWDPLAAHFQSQYHVVTMAYPGMDPNETAVEQGNHNSMKLKSWGYSNQEVTDALLAIVQDYRDAGGQTIFLVGHDWGSFPVMTLAWQHPAALTKVVSEDIGMVHPWRHDSMMGLFIILSYQTFLASLFVLTRLVGDWIAYPLVWLYPWRWMGPLRTTNDTEDVKLLSSYQLYPYYQIFRSAVVKGKFMDGLQLTKVPLLFVYGAHKRSLFHSSCYVRDLEQEGRCRVIEYTDAGHWCHSSHTDRMAQDMLDFFETTE